MYDEILERYQHTDKNPNRFAKLIKNMFSPNITTIVDDDDIPGLEEAEPLDHQKSGGLNGLIERWTARESELRTPVSHEELRAKAEEIEQARRDIDAAIKAKNQ